MTHPPTAGSLRERVCELIERLPVTQQVCEHSSTQDGVDAVKVAFLNMKAFTHELTEFIEAERTTAFQAGAASQKAVDAAFVMEAIQPGTVIKLDTMDQIHELPIAVCRAIAEHLQAAPLVTPDREVGV